MKACPSTIEDWQIAAEAKNCSSNGCSKYELYHCVPNETGQLEEVCTPPLYLQGQSYFIYFLLKPCIESKH